MASSGVLVCLRFDWKPSQRYPKRRILSSNFRYLFKKIKWLGVYGQELSRMPVRKQYDHSKNAGNLGDVWKHGVLIELSKALPGQSGQFRYVECHAGAPFHELEENGKWRTGVGGIVNDSQHRSEYISRARKWLKNARYPASWMFVSEVLSERFDVVDALLYDTAENVSKQFFESESVCKMPKVQFGFQNEDGYSAAEGLTDVELIFLDPPYNPIAKKDWCKLSSACCCLLRKQISFIAWYPFYWPTKPNRLLECTGCGTLEVKWNECGPKPDQNIKGCGMLISPELENYIPKLNKNLNQLAISMNAHYQFRKPER